MKKIFSLVLVLAVILTVFAGCAGDKTPEKDNLEAAKDYVHALYKDQSETTAVDFKLINSVLIDGVTYEVVWSVEVKSGNAEDVKVVRNDDATLVDVNEKAAEDVNYVLTATVKDASGKTATTTLNRKVPAYKEAGWNEYLAAATGDTVIVGGVVTGVISKTNGNSNNCLYIQGADDGGYYVYGMTSDPVADLGIKVGMTVKVVGTKDIYSGTLEIKDATVEVTDETVKEVAPVDFTEIYSKAASLKDDALVTKQAMLVTIKGVTVTGEDTGSGYYKFKLGDLETYVRVSSSVCPMTKDDQNKFTAAHAEHFGYIADVTGVICVYSGAFYLTPVSVDAFSNLSPRAR